MKRELLWRNNYRGNLIFLMGGRRIPRSFKIDSLVENLREKESVSENQTPGRFELLERDLKTEEMVVFSFGKFKSFPLCSATL